MGRIFRRRREASDLPTRSYGRCRTRRPGEHLDCRGRDQPAPTDCGEHTSPTILAKPVTRDRVLRVDRDVGRVNEVLHRRPIRPLDHQARAHDVGEHQVESRPRGQRAATSRSRRGEAPVLGVAGPMRQSGRLGLVGVEDHVVAVGVAALVGRIADDAGIKPEDVVYFRSFIRPK